MGGLISSLLKKLFSKNLDVVLVGLENAGKTTFCQALSMGPDSKRDPMPTIGLNITQMQKGGVKLKMWDIGGQSEFRSEWPRYTKDADVICFIVDIADKYRLPIARKELHVMLDDDALNKVPLLVLANKIDLAAKVTENEVIKALNLDYITSNTWILLPISAKYSNNIDEALAILTKYAK